MDGVAFQFPESSRAFDQWEVQSLSRDTSAAQYQAAVKKGEGAALEAWAKAPKAGPFMIQKTKENADRQWVAVLGPMDQNKALHKPDIAVNSLLIKIIGEAATPYATLGVTRAGSHGQIEACFKGILNRLHPAKRNLPGTKQAWEKARRAFGVLGTPEARDHYDSGGPGAASWALQDSNVYVEPMGKTG